MYGIAYSPYRRYGHCPTRRELSQDNVIARTHTQRIRLYSTECHHLNNVYLKAASMNRQGANFEVLLGVWIDRNAAKNAKEIQDLYVFLRRYPFARLSGIAVGNEVLYRKEMHPTVLAQKVAEVKAAVTLTGWKNAKIRTLVFRCVKLQVKRAVQFYKEFLFSLWMRFLIQKSLLFLMPLESMSIPFTDGRLVEHRTPMLCRILP